MSEGLTDYQATYRRQEFALPALLGVLAVLAAGVFAGIKLYSAGYGAPIFFTTIGVCLFALLAILLSVFRAHHWAVDKDGIHIEERPSVPLMGLPHRATLPFSELVAFRHVESGFDRLIEVVTRDGRTYRMPQKMLKNPAGIPSPDPAARLDDFVAAIRAIAARSGHGLPEISEGLSFWNRPAGLACQAIMLLVSLPIAAATAFALFDGGIKPGQPRGGQAIAIFLLLPVGAGYLMVKSLRRRRAVLASLRAATPAS
jgi:hypothetical protein